MKNTNTKEQILELLFNLPSKNFHIRECSRMLKISPPAVSKAVKELEKDNLIITEKSIIHSFIANIENPSFIQQKRVKNLSNVYTSGLFNFLKSSFPDQTIILIDNYSKGTDNEKSQIEIAILGSKEKSLSFVKFEEKLHRKIKIYFSEPKQLILNGIILQGELKIW